MKNSAVMEILDYTLDFLTKNIIKLPPTKNIHMQEAFKPVMTIRTYIILGTTF
jgi:hypothetical protein